jgi:5-methylcytosine-specific restriction endonuclease McrA
MRPKWRGDNGARRVRMKLAGATATRVTAQVIRQLMEAQGYRCACGCGQSIRFDYHLDHRIPLARGGRHDLSNWQLLTPAHNLKKGAK